MGCNELLQLLNTRGWAEGENLSICTAIATHVQTCPRCFRGIVRLAEAILTVDMLTCEQCRTYFPAYYEVTRPEYPLASLTDQEIAFVVLHLGNCAACSEEYRELVQLSALEEGEGWGDL
jgi:hypothetical protein